MWQANLGDGEIYPRPKQGDIPYSQTPEKHGFVQSLAADAREATVEIRIKECRTILTQSQGLCLEKMVGSDYIDPTRSKRNENFENRRSNE